MVSVTPKFWPGDSITIYAVSAVTGGRFVKASSTQGPDGTLGVVPCTAGAAIFGVAANDIALNGSDIAWTAPGTVVAVKVGTGGVTAGQEVESDASGQAVTRSTGAKAGTAVTDGAAGNTALIMVKA